MTPKREIESHTANGNIRQDSRVSQRLRGKVSEISYSSFGSMQGKSESGSSPRPPSFRSSPPFLKHTSSQRIDPKASYLWGLRVTLPSTNMRTSLGRPERPCFLFQRELLVGSMFVDSGVSSRIRPITFSLPANHA